MGSKRDTARRLPDHIRHLCIEGVIGAGKTSLCDLLGERCDARVVHEQAGENPFLARFYTNRKAYAFQTQMWFLLSRYRQMTDAFVQEELFYSGTVIDYLFAKDGIFAHLNLDENELALYRSISRILEPTIPQPDFVVYLQASTDVLCRRIEKRGRFYERDIDSAYVDALNQAYNHFFFHYTRSPLLIINTNEIDFVNNPGDLEEIVGQLFITKAGSNYYHPLGSGKGRSGGRTEDNTLS